MKNIIIYGAGGFGREVKFLIKQINRTVEKFKVIGFVDDNPELVGKVINETPVLGGLKYLLGLNEEVFVAIALTTNSKKGLVDKLKNNNFIKFCNLLHPEIYWDETNTIGEGNILTHNMNITCNIHIGNFNIFNGSFGLGHDVQVGDFNLFGPNSFIAGSVNIGNFNNFAMNTAVIQQRSIGDYNRINLNSVVIRNIKDEGVYFGIPATKQLF